jgi:transposase
MEEKVRFVFEYEREESSMTELCHRFEISRETGYVWLRRYRLCGVEGLLEMDRAPVRHPNQTCEAVERAVLELRQAHMRWGPRKLKRVLERDQPERVWPAASTIGAMVKRAGLVAARKKRRKTEPYSEPLGHAVESNRVWCADFKGWFRSGDGTRIDPLTISDAWSRYLLRCQAVEKTDTEYPDSMLVRTVKTHGHFRWNKHDVFLTEVLWGEPIGLLPVDDGIYTVYFAHLPLARFDSRTGKTYRLPRATTPANTRAGSAQASPHTAKQQQNLPNKEKVSAMCPV